MRELYNINNECNNLPNNSCNEFVNELEVDIIIMNEALLSLVQAKNRL